MQPVFGNLPTELLLHILDQLTGTHDGHVPIAYAPSSPITKALRALTLTSKSVYPIASRYLYAHCIYLEKSINYTRFRRTLGLHIGVHPEDLEPGQASRNDDLFSAANISQHITSLFLSPSKQMACAKNEPMIRTSQIMDLCNAVAPTLKRLVMDLQPIHATTSELSSNPRTSRDAVFRSMQALEELVVSYEILDYFSFPPLNVKHLAVTTQGIEDIMLDWFCFMPKLETLIVLREPKMRASRIEKVFDRIPKPRPSPLDVILVDVFANHMTPKGTRNWADDDPVRYWEIDVPTSYYGDDSDLIICDHWIWAQAVRSTLFSAKKRRMMSWAEVMSKKNAMTTAPTSL